MYRPATPAELVLCGTASVVKFRVLSSCFVRCWSILSTHRRLAMHCRQCQQSDVPILISSSRLLCTYSCTVYMYTETSSCIKKTNLLASVSSIQSVLSSSLGTKTEWHMTAFSGYVLMFRVSLWLEPCIRPESKQTLSSREAYCMFNLWRSLTSTQHYETKVGMDNDIIWWYFMRQNEHKYLWHWLWQFWCQNWHRCEQRFLPRMKPRCKS